MDKIVYIHYGDDEFRTMNPIRNRTCFTKPAGGLWASKKNDVYGWDCNSILIMNPDIVEVAYG